MHLEYAYWVIGRIVSYAHRLISADTMTFRRHLHHHLLLQRLVNHWLEARARFKVWYRVSLISFDMFWSYFEYHVLHGFMVGYGETMVLGTSTVISFPKRRSRPRSLGEDIFFCSGDRLYPWNNTSVCQYGDASIPNSGVLIMWNGGCFFLACLEPVVLEHIPKTIKTYMMTIYTIKKALFLDHYWHSMVAWPQVLQRPRLP